MEQFLWADMHSYEIFGAFLIVIAFSKPDNVHTSLKTWPDYSSARIGYIGLEWMKPERFTSNDKKGSTNPLSNRVHTPSSFIVHFV